MLNGGNKGSSSYMGLTGGSLSASNIGGGVREQRRPMWTQHEKAVLRLLMREYAGVTEYDPPDIHKHPIKNEMWRLLTARYNDHPNVRNRDTKQLRKAWENLKYRARKLGDLKKSGGARGVDNKNDAPDAPWPLEGIKLSLAGRESGESPNTREVYEDETKFMAEHDQKVGNSWVSDDNIGGSKAESPEAPIENVNRHSVLPLSSASRFGPPHFTSITSGDFFMSGARGAILNLQPLVNSLVGGALPALLPFLSPSAPPLPADLLLSNPFISSFFHPGEDTRSEASCSKDDELSRLPSPRQSCEVSNWASSLDSTKRVTPATSLMSSKHVIEECTSRSDLKQENPASPSDIGDSPEEEDADDESDLFVLQQKVSELLAKRTCEENEHSVTLQCLNLQMAHAEAQHEIKMKILATQLRFWQTKLQLLQEAFQKYDNTVDQNIRSVTDDSRDVND